jgi:virginiamycin A acetyltransferase
MNLLRMQNPPKCSVQVGAHTSGVPYIIAAARTDRVVIGKYGSIAHGVVLIPNNGHIPPLEYRRYRVSTYPMARLGKKGWLPKYALPEKTFIVIGNDVWIGANAIILPGVAIGDGAVIGAGAVVSHDIPPYAIAAGVPARILQYRYSADQIEKLLKIAWWNWSREKIAENVDYFYGNVDTFIEKFYEEGRL